MAEALERRGEGLASERGHERDAQLAEHFERAHVWTKALHYLVLAGERSCALFAMRDALHWLDRAAALAELHPDALDERQRLAVYERRGAARAQAGQTRGAVADIARVVEAARASGDRQRTRDALVQLGMAYRRADAYDDATACLAVALAESRAMHDERHAADTLYHLGTVAWSTGHNDQAIGHHQQAVEICERTGLTDLVAVQAYHGRGEAHFANAEPRPAIDCYTRSLALARGIGDKSYECENLMMIGHACIGAKGLGDYPRATTHFDAALEIARAADLQWHIGPTLLGLDHVRACTGDYGPAWLRMRETLAWLESLKQVRYQLIAHDFMGHLLLDLGLNEMALEHLEPRPGARPRHRHHVLARRARYPCCGRALAARAGRRCRGAAGHARTDAQQRRALHDGALPRRPGGGDAGRWRSGRCRAYADEMLALGVANGLREIEAGALRWRGEALRAEKAYAPAQAALSRAAALAEDIGRMRLQMDCQAALARLFAAQGQRGDAQRHAERAHATARGIESSLNASGLEASLVAGNER